MPNDYVTLKTLAAEIDAILKDGRVDRVNMPSDHDVLLLCRAKGKNRTLLLRALPGMPRVYLSEKKYDAPLAPPPFCMILRKYLNAAKILAAGMLNGDRIFYLDFLTRNELNDLNAYRLVFEMFTTKPNLLLLDTNGKILDCLKRNAEIGVLPRLPYQLPCGLKTSVEKVDPSSFPDPDLFYRFVCEKCFGLSEQSKAELHELLKIMPIPVAWDTILNQNKRFSPVAERVGDTFVHYAYPYRTIKGEILSFSSLSEAIEHADGASAAMEYKRKSTAHLMKTLKKLRGRFNRRMADHERRLLEGADKEEYKEAGELLKCAMFRMKKGMTQIEVDDYYRSGTRVIPLDPLLSPAENVAKYFKIYAKKKGAEIYALSESERLTEYAAYLDAIEESVSLCETEREYAEIENELNDLLGNKNPVASKRPKNRPSAPLHFVQIDCEFFVGRNNAQNQEVTFRIAAPDDFWLHAKDYHGAHVIVKGNPSSESLLLAASIAAYYSGGRPSDKVAVDCTKRKFVKSLHRPGMVTYRNQTSYYVTPATPDSLTSV